MVVDNNDLIHKGKPMEKLEDIALQMQSMVDHWEGELWTTGGALSEWKSDWHGTEFEWNFKKQQWECHDLTNFASAIHSLWQKSRL